MAVAPGHVTQAAALQESQQLRFYFFLLQYLKRLLVKESKFGNLLIT